MKSLALSASPRTQTRRKGARKIRSDAELREYFASSGDGDGDHRPSAPVMLEEFVVGRLVTYDGLTDDEGRVVFDSTMGVFRENIVKTAQGVARAVLQAGGVPGVATLRPWPLWWRPARLSISTSSSTPNTYLTSLRNTPT